MKYIKRYEDSVSASTTKMNKIIMMQVYFLFDKKKLVKCVLVNGYFNIVIFSRSFIFIQRVKI